MGVSPGSPNSACRPTEIDCRGDVLHDELFDLNQEHDHG